MVRVDSHRMLLAKEFDERIMLAGRALENRHIYREINRAWLQLEKFACIFVILHRNIEDQRKDAAPLCIARARTEEHALENSRLRHEVT